MKVYKTRSGALIDEGGRMYTIAVDDWDNFINDDNLFSTISGLLASGKAVTADKPEEAGIMAPIGLRQELWACGVTYLRSKVGRQEESKASGGADFYQKVYEAERPEVFFKSTPGNGARSRAFTRA